MNLGEFIDVKGWKALGNKVGEFKVLKVEHQNPVKEEVEVEKEEKPTATGDLFEQKQEDQEKEKNGEPIQDKTGDDDGLQAGDTIELDF